MTVHFIAAADVVRCDGSFKNHALFISASACMHAAYI